MLKDNERRSKGSSRNTKRVQKTIHATSEINDVDTGCLNFVNMMVIRGYFRIYWIN